VRHLAAQDGSLTLDDGHVRRSHDERLRLAGHCTIHSELSSDKHLQSTTKLNQTEQQKLECGPMPNVMAALPNTGGALCSTPQSLADAH